MKPAGRRRRCRWRPTLGDGGAREPARQTKQAIADKAGGQRHMQAAPMVRMARASTTRTRSRRPRISAPTDRGRTASAACARSAGGGASFRSPRSAWRFLDLLAPAVLRFGHEAGAQPRPAVAAGALVGDGLTRLAAWASPVSQGRANRRGNPPTLSAMKPIRASSASLVFSARSSASARRFSSP